MVSDRQLFPVDSLARPMSAHEVIPWNYNFEFLMVKGEREIVRVYSEDFIHVFENIMNFTVTIDSTLDHLWHSYIKYSLNIWKDEREYKALYCRDCITVAAFVDLSNTFKHSDRRTVNQFAKRMELEQHTEEWLENADVHEKSNAISVAVTNTQTGEPSNMIFSPVIHVISQDQNQVLRLPFRLAAELSIKNLRAYHMTIK